MAFYTLKFETMWCLLFGRRPASSEDNSYYRCGHVVRDFESEAKTLSFDKQDVIDFTKISKMTMCRASEANSEK